MANTTVLLRNDIDTLGGRGEVVKVKAGYARNYLLPRGLATLATKGNVKQIEKEREALLKRAAAERSTAEAQRDQMSTIALAFERKAGEGGTLFGSVTSMDITEAIKAKGYEIDRRQVSLREPIKETGDYTVNVKLYRDVVLQVPVKVTAEGGEVAEPKADKNARKEAPTVDATADSAAQAAGTTEETEA